MGETGKNIRTRRKQKNGQFAVAFRQLKRNRLAVAGLCVLFLIILLCLNESWLTPYEYDALSMKDRFQPPSWEHPFGTDEFGRDLLTRVLRGGQISLVIGLISVLLGCAMGSILGCSAAYFGGWYEQIVMRICDILMSMPALILAAAVATVLGTGVWKSVMAVSIAQVATFTRLMHSTALSIRGQEYLEAARAWGASRSRQIFKYLLPNCLPTLIVQLTMRFGNCITSVANLSFLGLGVQPPTPEWGSILNAGREFVRSNWEVVTFPGIVFVVTMLSVNLFGDGLRDALDPRLKR